MPYNEQDNTISVFLQPKILNKEDLQEKINRLINLFKLRSLEIEQQEEKERKKLLWLFNERFNKKAAESGRVKKIVELAKFKKTLKLEKRIERLRRIRRRRRMYALRIKEDLERAKSAKLEQQQFLNRRKTLFRSIRNIL